MRNQRLELRRIKGTRLTNEIGQVSLEAILAGVKRRREIDRLTQERSPATKSGRLEEFSQFGLHPRAPDISIM